MNKTLIVSVVVALSSSIAACGTSPTDRAISGAALGAGTGALGAAILDTNIGGGALLGGALGAGAGYLTDPTYFNLGAPPWQQ